MMSLTELQIKNASPQNKPYRLKDDGGLYMEVRQTGKKVWRMRYWIKGKENILTFGDYPTVRLKDARAKRDEARRLLADDIDPAVQRDTIKMQSDQKTFSGLAIEFYEFKKQGFTNEKSRYALEMRIKKHILPYLGRYAPDEITAPIILPVVRRLEAKGALVTAHILLSIIGQIFRYGIATGQAVRDPAADLRGALQAVPENNFAAIFDPQKFGKLLSAISCYPGSLTVKNAMLVLSYTFLRPGDLRRAEWGEIDLDKKEYDYLVVSAYEICDNTQIT
jgi:hypothetical protein